MVSTVFPLVKVFIFSVYYTLNGLHLSAYGGVLGVHREFVDGTFLSLDFQTNEVGDDELFPMTWDVYLTSY